MEHHALIYISPSLSLEQLPPDVQVPSADVMHLLASPFVIDTARELTASAGNRPLTATHRSFVIATSSFTLQAQNALLKIVEEPAPTARFYFVVPHEQVFIPTLRSRLHLASTAVEAQSNIWQEFAVATYADRLALIATKVKIKDIAWLQAVAQGAVKDTRLDKETAVLIDQYFSASGSSKKMLLELVALRYPVGAL